MRRTFVPDHDTARGLRVAFPLALHQHDNPARERGNLRLLTGHHIRQLLDRAGQMRNLFFEFFHGLRVARARA